MADYSSLKVPELKKLLQEKQLPVTGNKADLIARLQEHDKTQEAPKAATAPGSFLSIYYPFLVSSLFFSVSIRVSLV